MNYHKTKKVPSLHQTFRFWIFLILPAFSFSLFGNNESLRIESYFKPPSITLAGQTTYKIIIHGSQQNPQGSIPQIPGLSISNSPQIFRSASFVNGVPSIRLELSFQIKPANIGSHTIPSWPIVVGSKTLQVPASTLDVLQPNQQDIIRKNEEEKQKHDLKQASFIEFRNPRPYLFEGETVPANIELYIWDRLPVSRIENAPKKEGDAFSISELGQPVEKRNQLKFNKTYTIFSWPVGLTAAIAGQNNIKFSTSIRVRVKSNGNSPFNSPFFNDPFFGFGREESLIVSSENQILQVKELPMNGRPDSFLGAIGSFTSNSIPDADRVSLGDPVRLIFEIQGKGNFSAMPAPILESNAEFKIGPPAFSFEGNQVTKHEGKQRFEYIVSPLKAGLLDIPSISFSYFDPILEKYFSTNSETHSLRVDPGETWIDPTPEINSEETAKEPTSTIDLFQTENEPGEWVTILKNKSLLESKLFWYLNLLPLFSSFCLLFYGWKRKQSGRDIFRKKQAHLKKQLKDSVTYEDPEVFFRTARERIRLELGTLYKHPNPASLSSKELILLLENGSTDEKIIREYENLLRDIDDYEFADSEKESVPIEEIFKKINMLLKKVK